MSIYLKLHNIQSSIKALSKDGRGYNYGYVTGDKLLSHVKSIMDSEKLMLKQEILSIDNERMDYATKMGTKSEILTKVMMRFTWIDCETGEKDENLFGANGQNEWEKGLGSALTYGERYFLLKYFHIQTDHDDIDNPDRKPKSAQGVAVAVANPFANRAPAPAQSVSHHSPPQNDGEPSSWQLMQDWLKDNGWTAQQLDAAIQMIYKDQKVQRNKWADLTDFQKSKMVTAENLERLEAKLTIVTRS